tara:strand:- start:8235 stop:9473 length:1239 start_codon:yes stop_codon:yes gene_type:complete
MLIIYNIFLICLVLISPLFIIIRIFFGKEDRLRFKEKFCIFSKKNNIFNEIIWFHGASVGEILSIIPLIKEFEKDKNIKKILITSSTTSSSYIISKYKFKKTSHQYFPYDLNILTKIFINYWKPKIAIFVDSEIWPNMYNNLHKNNIPLILLNARITNKSFKRWRYFPNFAKKIFNKITIALPQNVETKKYLRLLGTKNIKTAGNLKFYGYLQSKYNRTSLKKKFLKRTIWCAASTHQDEELFIGRVHKELKLENKNLLTIIIPRHINRKQQIIDELSRIGLKSQLHTSSRKLKKNTDIYIVDTYGEASKFYSLSKLTFVGGSLISHGGQNPLEPAREGNYILTGPHIDNFKEVYQMLENLKIANKIKSVKDIKNIFIKKINFIKNKKANRKLNLLGNTIVNKNLSEIRKFI